mgnify:CR=1 FL=1
MNIAIGVMDMNGTPDTMYNSILEIFWESVYFDSPESASLLELLLYPNALDGGPLI